MQTGGETEAAELKRHTLWEGQTHIQISTLLLSSYGVPGPQTSHFISLGLSFHFCKVRIATVSTLESYC